MHVAAGGFFRGKFWAVRVFFSDAKDRSDQPKGPTAKDATGKGVIIIIYLMDKIILQVDR